MVRVCIIAFFLILHFAFGVGDQGSPVTKALWPQSIGDQALNMGLGSLAEVFYKEFLEQRIPQTQKRFVQEKLLTAFIQQGKYKEATTLAETIPLGSQSAATRLRIALIALHEGRSSYAQSLLKKISIYDISESDRSWYYLISGLLAQEKGLQNEAAKSFELARNCSQSEQQRLEIDAIVVRERIFSGKADKNFAANLREKISKRHDRHSRMYLQLVEQYAVVLDKLGQRNEAVDAINKALQLNKDKASDIDQLLFLKGLLLGVENLDGQQALKELIVRRGNLQLAEVALYMLARASTDQERMRVLSFVNGLIENVEHHPLLDHLLILRAHLYCSFNQLDMAEKDIQRLLKELPGSSHKKQAQLLAAYIAWKGTPPKYRVAADFLEMLRQGENNSDEKARVGLLILDCYYLNKDYALAANLCRELLQENLDWLPRSELAFVDVNCWLKLNDVQKAESSLQQSVEKGLFNSDDRCKSEWNLAAFKREKGDLKGVLPRIDLLLSTLEEPSLLQWHIRFLALNAQINLELKQYNDVLTTVLKVSEFLPKWTENTGEKETLAAMLELLKAQSLLGKNAFEEALNALQQLRQKYPKTDAAIRSYMIEAHYHANANRRVEAQQCLIRLVDNYPTTSYAPLALYEAAIHAELCGPNQAQKALELLDRLTQSYPQAEFLYQARLKQGDLLRTLNNFPAAQCVYEGLINENLEHPSRPLALLSYAKCLLAQPDPDGKRYSKAVLELEKLFEGTNVPADLRIESGFQLGYTQAHRKDDIQAQKVYLRVISLFLLDKNAPKLGSQGRYWISRVVLELSSILESQNKNKEAQNLYRLILQYRLPGESIVQSKLN